MAVMYHVYMLYSTFLHCSDVLYCTVLCHTYMLYCTVLYFCVLFCSVLQCRLHTTCVSTRVCLPPGAISWTACPGGKMTCWGRDTWASSRPPRPSSPWLAAPQLYMPPSTTPACLGEGWLQLEDSAVLVFRAGLQSSQLVSKIRTSMVVINFSQHANLFSNYMARQVHNPPGVYLSVHN